MRRQRNLRYWAPRAQRRSMTALLDRLRQITEAVPRGGAVVLPREWLEAELQALVLPLEHGRDLTVEQVAEQLSRPESTIRGWLGSGRFAGAYKRGRVWRVPRAALEDRRRPAPPSDDGVRLDGWRRLGR